MAYQENHTQNVKPVEQVKGAHRRTLVDGEHMMIIEWTMEPGTEVPLHEHMHEQSGYIVSGEMVFQCRGESHRLTPGMAYLVTGHEPHGAHFHEPTVVVDIFSPPREDYRGDKASTYNVVTEPAAASPSQAVAQKPAARKVAARKSPAKKAPAKKTPARKAAARRR